ncbi:hypothetical protein [Nocardia sp. NPDC051570]|uniref:hypothetical protein n=1 Tax=Nocardia sp. NPDC051570 TaxID=3364324 RepID=UPI0037BB35CB
MGKVRRKQAFELALAARVFIWVVLGAGIVVVALHVGNARSGYQHIPANPVTAIEELTRGKLHWPHDATRVVKVEPANGKPYGMDGTQRPSYSPNLAQRRRHRSPPDSFGQVIAVVISE